MPRGALCIYNALVYQVQVITMLLADMRPSYKLLIVHISVNIMKGVVKKRKTKLHTIETFYHVYVSNHYYLQNITMVVLYHILMILELTTLRSHKKCINKSKKHYKNNKNKSSNIRMKAYPAKNNSRFVLSLIWIILSYLKISSLVFQNIPQNSLCKTLILSIQYIILASCMKQ